MKPKEIKQPQFHNHCLDQKNHPENFLHNPKKSRRYRRAVALEESFQEPARRK